MKFKSDIEVQAGLKDKDGQLGTAGQLLSSTGTQTDWIDQSTIIAAAATEVDIAVKNLDTITLAKGTPVYIVGTVGTSNILQIAAAKAGDPTKMPSIGLLKQSLAVNGEGFVTVTGVLKNITTDPIDGVTPNEGDTLYIKSTGGLTTVKPTGATNQIQNVGKVGRVQGTSAGSIVVSCIMRSNDVPNLPTGKIWVGDGNTIVSDTVFLDEPNGRMGIGTTSPEFKLDVSGGSAVGARISTNGFTNLDLVSNRTSGNLGGLRFKQDIDAHQTGEFLGLHGGGFDWKVGDGSASPDIKMRLDNSGNVGIGTTSPGTKLQVGSGTADDVARVFFNDSTYTEIHGYGIQTNRGTAYFRPTSDKTQTLNIGNDGVTWNTINYNSNTHKFTNDLNEWLRIDSIGNVGIGTTAPGTKLEIRGTDPLLELNTASSTGNPYMMWSQAGVRRSYIQHVDSGDNLTLASEYGGMVFMTGTSGSEVERIRITSSGFVGIGTTNPTTQLDVQGSIQARTHLYFNTLGTSSVPTWGIGLNASGDLVADDISSGKNFLFSNEGNVGIGTVTPATKLSVNGGVQVAHEPDTASAALVGTLRYRTSLNNSYVDMCMQTGSTTYTWVNIVSNTW